MEMGGLRKTQVCLGSHRLGGPAKSHNGYYREDSLPSPHSIIKGMVKGVPVLVGLVLGLHHGDFHTLGSQLSGQSPKGLKCVMVCNE
jgi:hypothetical protein